MNKSEERYFVELTNEEVMEVSGAFMQDIWGSHFMPDGGWSDALGILERGIRAFNDLLSGRSNSEPRVTTATATIGIRG